MINLSTKIWLLSKIPVEWRDLLHSRRRFSFADRKHPEKQSLVIFFDGLFYHGGMCDRLKGMVSMFHFSKALGLDFRIVHTFPFELSDYLQPAVYDWRVSPHEISTHFKEAKFMNLIGDTTIRRLTALRSKKQIHCYANVNLTTELNRHYGTNFSWGELYKMLFRPTEKLRQAIDLHQSQIGGEYISAVFRFQSLLGDFREYDFPELDDRAKEDLILQNLSALRQLIGDNPQQKVLVTSDSQIFLHRAAEVEGVFVIPGRVVHIDNVRNESGEVYLKSFVDFYLLSESRHVYSIGTKDMYKTEFPMYAAMVNNVPFERILIP